MSGFVGSRARKKRRNLYLTFFLIVFISIFFYFLPQLQIINTAIIPNDNIIPNPIDDLNSLASQVEELELNLFNKDQKIKFRDGEITSLKTELKNKQLEYESIILEIKEIKNEYNTLLSDNENLISSSKYDLLQDNFTKLNIENDKNISKINNLNKKIEELNMNLAKTNDLIAENQQLKQNAKDLFNKNIQLENNISDIKNRINEQEIEIKLLVDQINKLKDKSHHGG